MVAVSKCLHPGYNDSSHFVCGLHGTWLGLQWSASWLCGTLFCTLPWPVSYPAIDTWCTNEWDQKDRFNLTKYAHAKCLPFCPSIGVCFPTRLISFCLLLHRILSVISSATGIWVTNCLPSAVLLCQISSLFSTCIKSSWLTTLFALDGWFWWIQFLSLLLEG